ncbi:hypothetical protein Tco_0894729 [Tanacetum coccineum]|uniref:Retrotransposon gag domain-containing protein n=1 Tax=Tanacetum coccineum TaxID=301880 RepID=A0ABQ5CEZ4_9ASTR
MSHHTLYGAKSLQDYAATFKSTRDDVSDSALRRNICDRGNVGSQRKCNHSIVCYASFIINMEDDVDINTLTIEQYMAWFQDNIRPGVVKPKIGNNVEFEINSNFMRELRRKLFKGTIDEDAHEHVRKVLEIVDLFHFPDVTHDAVMLRVFPITLKGPALIWINRLSAGLVTTWDLLEKAFIWQYCPPFKTTKKLEITVFSNKRWMRHCIMLGKEHSHNWYDETTTRELINDSPNNIDTKKPKENIHDTQANFKNCEGSHLTMEYPLEKEDKAVEQSKYMRSLKETIIKFCKNSISKQVADDEWIRKFIKNTDSNIRALKTTTKNLKETQTILTNTGNPYKTRKTICAIGIPEEIKEDEGDLNDGCDIAVEDVERLRKILTPPIHALPNLKPIVQPYMPLGLVYNKAKVVKEEEQDYDIPLHEHVMQPLAPQTVHTTPPDDDYVASATNPNLNKHLN